MFENIFSIAFLFQSVRITIPYLLPSLGGVFSEKSGVINIALEGIILIGAFAATYGTFISQNVFIGVLFGIGAGVFIAGLHALVTVYFKADQIVSGIALNLLAFGLTKFLCKIIFNSSSNSEHIVGMETARLSFFSFLPILENPLVILSFAILLFSNCLIYKTRFGLHLRSAGENPEAAHSLGIKVNSVRFTAVLISGALAGLGGVWLAFEQHSFTDGMSAGRGFIALAAMIIGKWTPYGAALACIFFGIAESLSIALQGTNFPTQLIQAIPYIITIIILAGFIGKAKAPEADGIPFQN